MLLTLVGQEISTKKGVQKVLSTEANLHLMWTESGLFGVVFLVADGFLGILFRHASAADMLSSFSFPFTV
jgi:hypothetical protein